MKNCKIAAAAFAALISAFAARAESLQEMIDAASKSEAKTLKLEAKTYFIDRPLELTAAHSGLTIVGAPISEAAAAGWYKGGRASFTVISGGRKISGWKRDGNFWKAKIDGENFISSMYVNGVRAKVAEYPNDDIIYFLPKDVRNAPSKSGRGSSSVFLIRNEDAEILSKLPQDELRNAGISAYRAWVHNYAFIDKIVPRSDGKTSAVYLAGDMNNQIFGGGRNPRFKFINIKGALDRGGEYYFDARNSEIWYMPREGENMETAEVYYPRVDTLVKAGGESFAKRLENLTIKNVAFEYASARPNLNARAWDNSVGQAQANMQAALDFNFAKNVMIQNCLIARIDGYAAAFGNSVWNSSIQSCVMGDIGGGGVRIGTYVKSKNFDDPENDDIASGGIFALNNAIFKFGRINRSCVGVIAFDVGGCRIENNDIFDGYYTGVSVGWTWGVAPTHTRNNKILFNRIHNLAYGQMCDLGGIYTLGTADGSEIAGNHIWGIDCHEYGSWGIYNDEGSKNFRIYKNFVRGAEQGGYNMHYGAQNKVYNNVICYGGMFQLNLTRKEPNSFSFERNVVCYESPAIIFRRNAPIKREAAPFDRNIYWNAKGEVLFGDMTFAQWQATGQDRDSFVEPVDVDALFKGAAIPKIGFEPLEMSKCGVQGVQKRILDEILRGYKYPEVRKYRAEVPWEREVYERFEEDVGDSLPVFMRYSGSKISVETDAAGGKRFLRIVDMRPKSEIEPFAAHRFAFDKKGSGTAEISFKMRLNPKSSFRYEVRSLPLMTRQSDTEFPFGKEIYFDVRNGALSLDGEKTLALPQGVWLDVRIQAPTNLKAGKGKWRLEISDGAKTLYAADKVCADKKAGGITWAGFEMCGEKGSSADFADIVIKRVK